MTSPTSPIYLIRVYHLSLENWRISRSRLQREINNYEALKQQIIDNQPNTNTQRASEIVRMYDNYIEEFQRGIDYIDIATPIYTNARNDGLFSIVRSSYSRFSLMYPEYFRVVGPFRDLPPAFFEPMNYADLMRLWEMLNIVGLA